MKYNFKKKLTAILSATLAAVTFLSVPASALEWQGSSGGGGGNGNMATKNNYTIADTSATACGYRFSRVDYYGNTKNGPIDVACSTYHTVKNAQTAYRFENKFNKLQLKNYMYSSIAWRTTSQWINTDTGAIGITLPTAVSQIQTTVMNGTNFDSICKALGMGGGANDLKNGDKILVEPLFALTLKGQRHVLTVTEIGIWGGYEFGWDIVVRSSTSSSGGEFSYITNYTNNCWPSSLYTGAITSGNTVFWGAGEDKWGNGKNVWQRLLTFRQMVENGYGVGLAYNNTNPPIETVYVDLYPTEVTWLDSNGNQTNFLIEGQTYTPVFHFYNAGSVAVYARVASWSYPYWKDVLYDGSGNTSTRIRIGANQDYAINSRETITIKQGLRYGDGTVYTDYDLSVTTIKHKLSIALDCTESTDSNGDKVYVKESNTGNNIKICEAWFSPKQPSISQWVVDEENANSNWINTDAITGKKRLYSGEQVNSYLWLQNNSSFNINIIDKFKAILGLENNILHQSDGLKYFFANGKEGDRWTRNSGIYRVKNTKNNTLNSLYLLDTAAEKSYAEGTNTNISNVTTIANNISLNQKIFYTSDSWNDGAGKTGQKSWDNSSRILTINGTVSGGFKDYDVSFSLKKGKKYRFTAEYVSGSVSSANENTHSCFVFETGEKSDGSRLYSDISLPNFAKIGSPTVTTGDIIMDHDSSYLALWLWVNGSTTTMTFNNYKVKIKVEEVEGTDWDMYYTKNINTYKVLPTDLEASALNLYYADTGERVKEGTVLKAGQKVYSETTYTNYTETAVAATFRTKHDNNSNTEYHITDTASMASSVKPETPIKDMSKLFENKTVKNSKGESITQSWDGNNHILTINGSGTANFEPIASVAAEFKEGNTYRVTLEYVSGTLTGAKNYEIPTSGLFFTAAGGSNSQRRIYVDVDYPKFNAKNSNTCAGEFTMLRDSGTLYIGIFFNDSSTNITYNNYKIKVNIEKVSPNVSWNSDTKTLSVSGTYDRNRVFIGSETLGRSGQSSDGKLTYSVQKTFEEDGFYLTLNGYTYGSNNGYNLFPNVTTEKLNLKDGDRYIAKAEYISGSLKEDTNDTLTILALRQYREDGSEAKNSSGNTCWFDLLLPHSSGDKYAYSKPNSDTTVSWEMAVTSNNVGNLANNTLKFGLWAYDKDTGNDGVTFNNYRVKITFEKINHYPSVNETVVSDTMSLDANNSYNVKFKNIGGSVAEGNAYLSVQYLDKNGTVIDTHDMPVSSTDMTSYGISRTSSSVVSFRLVLKSDTGTGRKVTYNDLKLYLDLTKNSMTQCNVSSDSNSVHDETCVIAAKQSVTVRSDVFEISAIPHNKITLSAYIYLKNLVDNTEYEYNENNNTLQKEFVIETPFKPTVVQANSEYRRGITVITSYKIKNDSKRDYGTTSDINTYGGLTAKLELYRNSSMTGTPFATVYCDYCVPMDGKETLVWFEWKVPTDSPDKLYAKMTCDAYNRYSSIEFIDNGNNSKNTYCVFNIVQPKVTSTPDTTFAKEEPYWYESGYKSAKAPSEDEGLRYYSVTAVGSPYDSASWYYYVADGDNLVLKKETATLKGSTIELIPEGAFSATMGYDGKWNTKSGYGYNLKTEFKTNSHSTAVQSGYAVFPELLYRVADNVNGYTNISGVRTGLATVKDKIPSCGGTYATYSTLEKKKDGTLVLPNNENSKTATHFIPIWYPISDYSISCYVADAWTPGGMLAKKIDSSTLHIVGNMYDDYVVSEK